MPRRRVLRPRLLAAVIRSSATLAFAAERQVVRQTGLMDLQVGQRLVVLRDIEAHCFVGAKSMLSDLQVVRVRAGEVLVVSFILRPGARSVSVRPHRYEALEEEFVSPETRSDAEYHGYHLSIDHALIETHCRLLEAGAG